MNVSYNWLKDYLDFDLSPEDTSKALTSLGLEVEGVEEVETIKGGLKGLVIGEVLTCIEHENSDHLHVTTVNVGEAEPLQIVCGAPNIAAGQKVVVATVGAVLYDGDEEFKIKKSKIRGVESLGMICSAREIGVGASHEGIIELPLDAKVGTLASVYYGVESDYLIEVDITPNRVDAASHYGVARDLAAYLKQNKHTFNLKNPSVDNFNIDEADGGIQVKVEDVDACPRYAGLTIKGVKVTESPKWLQDRLNTVGLRPINNVVDITNYVLHEFGHPLHAFDVQKIDGEHVIVKKLRQGTKFVTLDEVERTLDENDLMICNSKEPMCIGGVFGGLNSGVVADTTDVFLECAYFKPMSVRKTARRQGLNTDSSFRFERGANPNDTLYVLKRAALLIQEIAGGKIVGQIEDHYPNPIEESKVLLTYDKVNKLIGNEIPKETVKSILESLEIKIENETESELSLSVPTYRVDVKRDVDVIEDILRVYGYNNLVLNEQVSSTLSYQSKSDRAYDLQNIISDMLSGGGFNEIMNNSLTKEEYYKESTLYPADNSVYILNALSSDLNVMRQTLLYAGLESIAYNRNRKNSDIKFYEFGNCYSLDKSKKSDKYILAGYSEDMRLALWLSGDMVADSWVQTDEKATIYHLKSYVENVLIKMGLRGQYSFEQFSNEMYSTGLIIKSKTNKELGTLGIVAKDKLKKQDIDAEVFYAELSWTSLVKEVTKHIVNFEDISKFPSVERDFALLIDQNVTFDQIEQLAYKAEKKLLKNVQLFDVYEGKNLPAGKKSYAVKFLIHDEEKTLKDSQIDAIMKKIQGSLEHQLGAQLR